MPEEGYTLMQIQKRLTPALSTSLFLLVSIACQVVTMKIFKLVTGDAIVQENAYVLTKIMAAYLVVISITFAVFTRFTLHWECFKPARTNSKRTLRSADCSVSER